MAVCTIFKNFATPVENVSLIILSNWIASDKYKKEVDVVKTLIAQGKTEEASQKKSRLPAFTPSATFNEKRLLPNLNQYSGFVHLDFDKLAPEQLDAAFQIIIAIPFTFLCFISPSGNGLKAFIEVNTGAEQHDIAYRLVMQYYEKATGLKADEKCKDITRLCFVSHDPQLYKNIYNEKFQVADQPTKQVEALPLQIIKEQPGENESDNYIFTFQQQVLFTNKKLAYTNGNRNNYMYLLASNCNRAGIPELDTLQLCAQHFDLSEKEIKAAVSSAYLHHLHEHKKFEPKATASTNEEQPEEPQMPTLPDDIFNTIPQFLQQITQVSTTKEERDILLLGSLVTLSVAFPTVIGKYGDNPVNANLFIFISAKASGGKGVLIHCRKLIEPIHLALREQAKILKKHYDVEMMDYNANKTTDRTIEKPNKPPQKMLFIPANNSATGFLEILNDSDKRGIIFETEGDTLSKSFKSDYGDFSDGFRQSFQHEPISYYRRTDKEYVEIDRPCLSALLSGTPRQIQVLIPNAENGLFSRFMFYCMNMKLVWKDVFASKTENGLDVHFEKLGKEFYNLYQILQTSPEIQFTLTSNQQTQFNQFFEQIQVFYFTIHQEDYIASVRRLGLTAFRIMMIFTALRMMESGEVPTILICEDIDFDNTLKMISILLKHSSYVYTQIAQENHQAKPKNRKEIFLENLPATFNRQTYVAIGLKWNIPDKTAQRYIKDFVTAGILQSPSFDCYIYPTASNTQ